MADFNDFGFSTVSETDFTATAKEPETKVVEAAVAEAKAGQIKEVEFPKAFSEIPKWHKIIAESDMAKSFSIDYQKFKSLLSNQIVVAIVVEVVVVVSSSSNSTSSS